MKNSKYTMYYAYLLSIEVGQVGQKDKCWILEWERDNGYPTTEYVLYKMVGKAMEQLSSQPNNNILSNITQNNVERTSTVYPNSFKPITIDQDTYEYFKTKIPKKATGEPIDLSVCHHPFLCEKNEACKGRRKKNAIPHCCFRPSHLVNLNKKFNDLCTVLQKIEGDNNKPHKITW